MDFPPESYDFSEQSRPNVNDAWFFVDANILVRKSIATRPSDVSLIHRWDCISNNHIFESKRIYREGLLDGTFSQNDGWQASYGISTAMARLGKTALMNFMESLPRQQQDNLVSNCIRELAALR